MTRRLLVAIVFVMCAVVPCEAQDAPPAGQKPAATGRISGRVVAADTGKPLRWAQVRLVSQQGRQLAVGTDAQGRYEIKDLAPGRYLLSARAERYLSMEFGGKPDDGRLQARPIDLKEGEHFAKGDFALPRGGALEGRVVDEFGDPAPGITIQVSRLEYAAGRRRLMPVGSRTQLQPTDDRGHFRVFGLQPGDYYVSALSGAFTEQNESGGFAPTYYPGTPDAGAAQRIRVGYGQEITSLTMQLIPARTARIAGRMVDANGQPVRGTITLSLADRLGISDFFFTRGTAAADGTFVFRNVPPGSYTLQGFGRQTTSAGNAGASEFGWLPVVVDGADHDDLVLSVRKGASLRGRIVLEETSGPPLRAPDVRVTAIPVQFDSAPVGGGPPPSETRNDWTFSVDNLSGHRLILVSTRSPEWTLKQITLDGRDVTDSPVDFTKGDIDGVEVTLTSRGPSLTGGVTDAQAAAVSDCVVILFAADKGRWTDRSRYVLLARPSQGGRFTLRGLPPESYLAIALPGVIGSEWQDPDVLDSLRDRATPVTLSEGEAKTIDLKLQQRR